MPKPYHEAVARRRFARNLAKAQVQDLLGLLTGHNTNLVNFHEVARRLRARQEGRQQIQEVPVAKIVGSVGRYHDFTSAFLPRARVNQDRWSRLDAALNALEPIPPVELYKIGDVYFVRDGNHRVSVAQANGIRVLEAYVTELESPVALTLDDFERDRWISKVEYVQFLKETELHAAHPEADLLLTAPGNYAEIRQHIQVHAYLRNQELERDGASHRLQGGEIASSWYSNVYLPVVEAIRRYQLLAEFPERTEADLYLWIARHREELAACYGIAPLSPDAAVTTFAETHSDLPVERTLKGLRQGLHQTFGDAKPLGMSEEEFHQARARHEAGELSLREAEALAQRGQASDDC